eukprot:2377011-Amphidinium_carterae.1
MPLCSMSAKISSSNCKDPMGATPFRTLLSSLTASWKLACPGSVAEMESSTLAMNGPRGA